MPLFEKGKAPPGAGRPKGVKNRFRLDAAEVFKKNNYNPLIELITLAKRKDITDRIKLEADSELCQYLYPKLKAMEITADELIEKFQLVMNVSTNEKDNVHSEQGSEPVSS